MRNINEVKKIISDWNKKVEDFTLNKLPKILKEKYNIIPSKNGLYPIKANFIGYTEKKEHKFYENGMKILKQLQSEGFDVRMNMQDNTLVYYGIY